VRFCTRRLAALVLLVIVLGSIAPARVVAARQNSVAAPPPNGAVVFVGSSIFRRWTRLSEQMAPLPVVNRGIDGIQTMHVLAMIDRTVLPLKPKVVVYYCGSNDVDAGDSAEAIFGRIRQFVDRVSAALPATRIVFVSINRAPEKQDRWDVVDAVNRQVEAYAAKTTRLQYVDVNPVLFNRDGSPRIDLYMPDELHLRPPAYEGFARILKPILTKAFETP
jgi:lysophospholipase L1-like esterase